MDHVRIINMKQILLIDLFVQLIAIIGVRSVQVHYQTIVLFVMLRNSELRTMGDVTAKLAM